MKFNKLKSVKQTTPRRVGRGIAAGRGKTAGRGTKGQGSRKSPGRIGFEGGQTPLTSRIPKLPGFRSIRVKPEVVYTKDLNSLKTSSVDNYTLAEAGLISSPHVSAKLILNGEIKTKKLVKLQLASVPAIEALKKADGSFEKVERLPRPKTRSKQ